MEPTEALFGILILGPIALAGFLLICKYLQEFIRGETKVTGEVTTVQLKENKETGESYLDLKELLAGSVIKPEDVSYYELTPLSNGFVVKLFDNNKNQLELK